MVNLLNSTVVDHPLRQQPGHDFVPGAQRILLLAQAPGFRAIQTSLDATDEAFVLPRRSSVEDCEAFCCGTAPPIS